MSQNVTHCSFNHVILQGSAYDAGVQQGQVIQQIPGFTQFLQSGKQVPNRQDLGHTLALMRRFCPGLEEEINGVCDVLHIHPADMVYYATTHLAPQHCSHLAALPRLTANGHTLVARNYDFNETMDDLRLVTTRINGKAAHLGFSVMLFGRCDGMNEHGLSVTMSAGGMPVGSGEYMRPALQDGLHFWALVRSLLEECRTLDEALAYYHEFPCCSNPILILADASGHAAVAETYGAKQAVRRVDAYTQDGYVFATNHFCDPALIAAEPTRQQHSLTRAKTMEHFLTHQEQPIAVDDLKALFSASYPAGLNCHYYADFFGTLHSLIFDLNERSAHIAFGSPAANPWQLFQLGTEIPDKYSAKLPQEVAPSGFWVPTRSGNTA